MIKIDYDIYVNTIIKQKSYVNDYTITPNKRSKLKEIIKKSLNTVYNTICIDIDKTITENNDGEEVVSKKLIKGFRKIARLGCYVCFITGRGKENAKKAIISLIDLINEDGKSYVDYTRWFCIINNGVCLLYSTENSREMFLNESHELCKNINKFKNEKKILRTKIAKIISKHIGISNSELIELSEKSSGETSLRFPIENTYDSDIYKMINRDIIRTLKNKEIYISQGIYKNQKVFEVSPQTKGKAIKSFCSFVGLSTNNMIMIGDQGDETGNDHSLLDFASGFSVDKFSKNYFKCFPVIDWNNNYKIIKNIDATSFILENLYFYPSVTLTIPNRVKYLREISRAEKKCYYYSKKILFEYTKKISSVLKEDIYSFSLDELYDFSSGAIYLNDWEYCELFSKNSEHILFKIFLKGYDNQKNIKFFKYVMHVQNGIILRGSSAYYYGLCNRVEKDFNRFNAIGWHNNIKSFISNTYKALKTAESTICLKNKMDRKVILGIVDNVRNFLLLSLNVLLEVDLQKNNLKEINSIFLLNSQESDLISECYKLAASNSKFYYDLLFYDDVFNISNYIDFLECISSFYNRYTEKMDDVFNDNMSFDYNNAFRVWRETDNFLENIIAIQEYLKKLQYKEIKCINFYGIRYGSIELPILGEMILFNVLDMNIDVNVYILSLKGNYMSRHSSNCLAFNECNQISSFMDYNDSYQILMDDNILTGKTIQIGIEFLVMNNIYPDKIIVIRYPSINRIEQMLYNNSSGAPDTTLLFDKIEGLITAAPYSKISQDSDGKYKNFKFTDKLGIFNESRYRIVRYLYLNDAYIRGTEVEKIGKGVE